MNRTPLYIWILVVSPWALTAVFVWLMNRADRRAHMVLRRDFDVLQRYRSTRPGQ